MGFLARRKARKEANERIAAARYRDERTNVTTMVPDPASTALLYTTVVSSDVSDQADDTAVDDTPDAKVDSYESESDRYSPDTNYGSTYEAPTYDFSGPNDTQSYGSSDSGSSYSDSGSSDSGSSSSSFD